MISALVKRFGSTCPGAPRITTRATGVAVAAITAAAAPTTTSITRAVRARVAAYAARAPDCQAALKPG